MSETKERCPHERTHNESLDVVCDECNAVVGTVEPSQAPPPHDEDPTCVRCGHSVTLHIGATGCNGHFSTGLLPKSDNHEYCTCGGFKRNRPSAQAPQVASLGTCDATMELCIGEHDGTLPHVRGNTCGRWKPLAGDAPATAEIDSERIAAQAQKKIYDYWTKAKKDFGQASWQSLAREAIQRAVVEELTRIANLKPVAPVSETPQPSTLTSQLARYKAIEEAPEHKMHVVLRTRVDTWKDDQTGTYIARVPEDLTSAATEEHAIEAAKSLILARARFALEAAGTLGEGEAPTKKQPIAWQIKSGRKLYLFAKEPHIEPIYEYS